jgi:oligopeptide transport system permease protein
VAEKHVAQVPSQSGIHDASELEIGTGFATAAEPVGEGAAAEGEGPWRRARTRFARNRAAVVSLAVLSVLAVMAMFAPLMHTENPLTPDFGAISTGPSAQHWFGTDPLGRDLYSRLVYGLRVPLVTAFVGAFISVFIGCVLGMAAGYFGGIVDSSLARLTDLVFALPAFILALVVVSFFGPALEPYFGGAGRVFMLCGVFALVSWPVLMRLVRSVAQRIREESYVEAARVCGGRNWAIIRRHVLPNVLGVALVQGAFIAISLVSIEAFLSILGLGVQAPNPDVGAILNEGVQHMGFSAWEVVFPAGVLAVLIITLTFVGDGLRDALDTRID